MKENIKYPTILKSIDGSQTVVVYKDGSAYHIDGDFKGEYSKAYNTDDTVNAGKEVLASTYGKVESKEHAEFVVELAGVNGVKCYSSYKSYSSNGFCFYVNGYGELTLAFMHIVKCMDNAEKPITIPLQPKQGGDSDEWPMVGSKVNWGNTSKGEVKSISDGFAWVKTNGGDYHTVYVSSLKKPKTPEEELRDDIELIIKESLDEDYSPSANAEHIASEMLDKYNITKKQ